MVENKNISILSLRVSPLFLLNCINFISLLLCIVDDLVLILSVWIIRELNINDESIACTKYVNRETWLFE